MHSTSRSMDGEYQGAGSYTLHLEYIIIICYSHSMRILDSTLPL